MAKILHTSQQSNCRDMYTIAWQVRYILNQSTRNFDRISNVIEIPLVGRAADTLVLWCAPTNTNHPASNASWPISVTMHSCASCSVAIGDDMKEPGQRLNIKTIFPGMLILIIKIRRSSYYIFIGDPYAGRTASLYFDPPGHIVQLLKSP